VFQEAAVQMVKHALAFHQETVLKTTNLFAVPDAFPTTMYAVQAVLHVLQAVLATAMEHVVVLLVLEEEVVQLAIQLLLAVLELRLVLELLQLHQLPSCLVVVLLLLLQQLLLMLNQRQPGNQQLHTLLQLLQAVLDPMVVAVDKQAQLVSLKLASCLDQLLLSSVFSSCKNKSRDFRLNSARLMVFQPNIMNLIYQYCGLKCVQRCTELANVYLYIITCVYLSEARNISTFPRH
jgi:hypothetical protein